MATELAALRIQPAATDLSSLARFVAMGRAADAGQVTPGSLAALRPPAAARGPQSGLAAYGPPPSARSGSPITFTSIDPTSEIGRYATAISAMESSHDYSAMGRPTRTGDRAYGRYQVMGNNVGPWTEQYFGRRLTPEEFVASPAAQDAVFSGRFGSYVSRYGNPNDAASAWFTGQPQATGNARRDPVSNNMSGADYVSRFLRFLPPAS